MTTLEEFAAWWLRERPIVTPMNGPLKFDGAHHGVVLYRDGPWQVQLFTIHPNSEGPDHVHPNVDSIEVYVAGEIAFRHSGKVVTPPERWGQPDLIGTMIRVRPNDSHGGSFGPAGGAFLSIQHWQNGVLPTSVDEDWAYTTSDTKGKTYIR